MVAKPKKARKKRGRPPLPPEAGKRFPLNMRTTKNIRDELQAAAHASGRSLAQEVEYRLEQSFQVEKNRYREFRNKKTYHLMRWFAATLRASELFTEKSWVTDEETFLIALEAMKTLRKKPAENITTHTRSDGEFIAKIVLGINEGKHNE